MTDLIGWSRHVMDVSLVGNRLPYFVRNFSSTASCAKVSLNMWNTSAIFQVHIFLGLKRCFPAMQQMMTFILIADSVAISINIFPPGAKRYYMPLKRVVYRTLCLRRDPILYVIGPGGWQFACFFDCRIDRQPGSHAANTKHLYNIYTTSAQRLRHWSNIVLMLYKCFVLAEIVGWLLCSGLVAWLAYEALNGCCIYWPAMPAADFSGFSVIRGILVINLW